jgi:hypothetical protein
MSKINVQSAYSNLRVTQEKGRKTRAGGLCGGSPGHGPLAQDLPCKAMWHQQGLCCLGGSFQ